MPSPSTRQRTTDSAPDEGAGRRSALWLLIDLLGFHIAIRLVFETLVLIQPRWRGSVLGREPRFPFEMPAMIGAMLAAVLLVLPLLRRISTGCTLADLGIRRTAPPAAWSTAIVITALGVGVAATWALILPEQTIEAWHTQGVRSSSDLLVFVVIAAPVFAALSEEVLYRGIIQSSLERIHTGWGPMAALLSFASIHAYQGWVAVAFFTLPMAVLFTTARRLQPGLGPLIAAHLVLDVVLFLELFLIDQRPDLRIAVTVVTIGVCIGILVTLRRVFPLLVAETRAWVGSLTKQSLAGHLPWVVAFVVGGGLISLAVATPHFAWPTNAIVLSAIFGGQALRRRTTPTRVTKRSSS